MKRSIIKNLSGFTIKEIIYNTGVSKFSSDDLDDWEGKSSTDFLDYYVENITKNVERSNNTLECYYLAKDFTDNIEEIPFNTSEFGMIELSRIPLYSSKTNEKIGLVSWLCVDNKKNGNSYIDCTLIYYIDSKYIPENISNVNENAKLDTTYSIAKFNFTYLSRPDAISSTFFSQGDYFTSEGYYSLESGLNKTIAINNIYLPVDNTGNLKRTVILNFPSISSNNFISQNEYGTEKFKNELNNILSQVNNEFLSNTTLPKPMLEQELEQELEKEVEKEVEKKTDKSINSYLIDILKETTPNLDKKLNELFSNNTGKKILNQLLTEILKHYQ